MKKITAIFTFLIIFTTIQSSSILSCLLSYNLYQLNENGAYSNEDYIGIIDKSLVILDSNIKNSSNQERNIKFYKYIKPNNQIESVEEYYFIYFSSMKEEGHEFCVNENSEVIKLFRINNLTKVNRKFLQKDSFVGKFNDLIYINTNGIYTFYYNSSYTKDSQHIYLEDGSNGHFLFIKKRDSKNTYDIDPYHLTSYLKNKFNNQFEFELIGKGTTIPSEIYKGDGYLLMNILESDEDFENKLFNYIITSSDSPVEDIIRLEIAIKYYKKLNIQFKKQSFSDKFLLLPNKINDFIQEKDGSFTVFQDVYRGLRFESKSKIVFEKGEILLNTKFLSTSLNRQIAVNISTNGKSKFIIHIKPDSECALKVLCYHCRGKSYKSEMEVLFEPMNYFIVEGTYQLDLLEVIIVRPYCFNDKNEEVKGNGKFLLMP